MVAATKNPDSPAVAAPPADVNALIAEQVKKQISAEAEKGSAIIRDIRDVQSGAKVVDLASYTPTKAKKIGNDVVVDGQSFVSKGLKLPPHVLQGMYDLTDAHKGLGMRAAQYVKAITLGALNAKSGAGDIRSTAKQLESEGKLDPFVTKALLEGTILDGGIFVPPEFSNELIPLLRNEAVLLASGIRTVPMSGDQLVYGRQNAAATGYYVGETFVTTYSQAQTGQLVLKTKKVKAITAISDELLRDGGPAADEFIRDDLVRVLALRMDLAGLLGDGTQETPLGLRYATAAANVAAATQAGSAATFQEISADASKAISGLEQANIPKGGWGWLMSPRSKNYLANVSSTFGVYPFREEVLAGKFQGLPIFITAAIPNIGGGGANESTVMLNAAPQFLFGQREGLVVQAFPGGTFQDASGSLVSGITTGQTPITAEMRHDFAMRYTQSNFVLTTVKWGA